MASFLMGMLATGRNGSVISPEYFLLSSSGLNLSPGLAGVCVSNLEFSISNTQ